jgi:hypothetical protein
MAFELSHLRLNYFGRLAVFKMQDHLRSQQLPTKRIFSIPPAYDQAALDDS